ncbi:MAG: rRNA maturation RNase YbeY [Spirochaetota bacterium]|nr:rRNA maturation RNase YbeY [Spirochaetota bacterium]
MFEIVNLTTQRVDKKYLSLVADKTLKFSGIKDKSLSLVLVGEQRIRNLNKKYRKKNKVTDVLSFGMDGTEAIRINKISEINKFLGEIVICPSYVRKSAKRQNRSYQSELTEILIHGILHLLGYDHEHKKENAKKMLELQKKILNSIK